MQDIKIFILESLINENKLLSNNYYINDATPKYKDIKEVIKAFKTERCPILIDRKINAITKLVEDNIELTHEVLKDLRKKYKETATSENNVIIFVRNNKGVLMLTDDGFESLFDIENGVDKCDWILKTDGGYHSNGKHYSYKEIFAALNGLIADIYEYDKSKLKSSFY